MASTKAAMQSEIESLRTKLDYTEQQLRATQEELASTRKHNAVLRTKLHEALSPAPRSPAPRSSTTFRPDAALLAKAAQHYPGRKSFTRDELLAIA